MGFLNSANLTMNLLVPPVSEKAIRISASLILFSNLEISSELVIIGVES